MTQRKHIGVGYHHNGILVMSAIGLAVLYVDYLVVGKDITAVMASVTCVGAVMLLQLIIDYIYYEEEYIFLTTEQRSRSDIDKFKERFKYKWPVLLIIPLFILFRPLSVGGTFFLSMMMTYPLQRRMYLRSLKEFGVNEDSAI